MEHVSKINADKKVAWRCFVMIQYLNVKVSLLFAFAYFLKSYECNLFGMLFQNHFSLLDDIPIVADLIEIYTL